ncbi:MAG: sigma-54-dependent Fis family transcriptional regulator [Spirochaetales bacterium]|nr:sigma-54-dependent Fis family transcriptional regulator [Spirochaetales bacterium]
MNVLIIDDEAGLRSGIKKILMLHNYNVYEAENRKQTLELLAATSIHLVLLDLRLGNEDGFALLQELKSKEPLLSIIIITGYGDVESAVDCMRAGAVNYITKPIDDNLLLSILDKESSILKCQWENLSLKEELKDHTSGVFLESKNPQFEKINKIITKIKDKVVPVFILGETGTGKELFARKIHYSGSFKDKPFIGLNCAALNDNLLESELFGHEKGAFTGAVKRKLGRFELAHDGTLFLDEIGDTSLSFQTKLLRIIQEKKYERVGGTQTLDASCRIITATNRNIQRLLAEKTFREDLYFRLSVIAFTLPPLRERKEDIPGFITLFIAEANKVFNKRVTRVSKYVMKKILDYSWPGNIRQLKNAITNAVLLNDNETIETMDFPEYCTETELPKIERGLKNVVADQVKILEIDVIKRVLQQHKGNISNAAKELKITRKTLYEKIKQYNL